MKIRARGKVIEISPNGERLVFTVGVGEGAYRVDLEAANGKGWCDCEDFRFRVRKIREKGFPDAECKHIRQCRSVLGTYFAKRVSDAAGVRRAGADDP